MRPALKTIITISFRELLFSETRRSEENLSIAVGVSEQLAQQHLLLCRSGPVRPHARVTQEEQAIPEQAEGADGHERRKHRNVAGEGEHKMQ